MPVVQIEEGGCTDWGHNTETGVRVQDARKLRQFLATKLLLNPQLSDGSTDLRKDFLLGLEEAVQDDQVLRHTLYPMVVSKVPPLSTISLCHRHLPT